MSAPRRGQQALLLVVAALTQVVTYVVRPTATYRAIELDVPPGWLGVLAASFAVMPLLLALPSGALTDRLGERWVAVAGGLVLTASTLVFLTAGRTVGGLVVATMLLGTGHLLCVVSQQALVANTAARQRLDTSFGHYTFAASLGQALGPAAIVAFGRGGPIPDTHAVFVASALFSAVLTALSMGLQRLPARVSRASTDPTASVRTLLRLPGLLRALTTSCVILAAVDITLVYLPALGAERDLSVAVVGGLLGARAAASMVSRLFLGRLTARAGRRQVLVTSTAVAALGTAAVAVPMPLPVLTAVVILMGLGLGVGQPVTMAWLAETSPPGMRGRSMSLRLLGNRAGQLVVPSAMGLVAADLGSAGVLCGTAAALAGAAVTARNITQPGAAGAGEPT